MPSPLRIDINGAGGTPPLSDLPEVDMDQEYTPVAPGTDLTGGGMDDLDSQRAALPPDPMDSLHNADQSLLAPLDDIMGHVSGGHDRLQAALADSEAMGNRGRDELLAMRSHLNRGNPWFQFAGAVMQPSWAPMASVGKAVSAFGSAKDRLSQEEMGIDRALGEFDNQQAQQQFKNRMGLEDYDIGTMGAASKLAAVQMAIRQYQLKMGILKGMIGAPGGIGGVGAPADPNASLQRAFVIESATGMPAMKAWSLAHPDLQLKDNGKFLLVLNPKTGQMVGQPIPKQLSPDQSAQLGQHAAEFQANTGVAIPGGGAGGQPSGVPASPGGSNVQPTPGTPATPNAQPSLQGDQGNAQPSSAPAGNNQGTPNATQSQNFDSSEPSMADISKNVDQYVASQNLPAVAAQKTRATLLGQQQKNLDNVRSAIDTTNAVVSRSDQILDKVSQHPNLQSGPIGAVLSHVWGLPQYDTAKQLETIKHNMMRDAIDALRASSPTGALNMRITEAELEQMQSRIANLSVGQSPKQFMNGLRDIRDHFLQMQGRARQNYERVYGATPDTTLGVKRFYPTEVEAEEAAKNGEIQSGDRVYVGGRPGTWQ